MGAQGFFQFAVRLSAHGVALGAICVLSACRFEQAQDALLIQRGGQRQPSSVPTAAQPGGGVTLLPPASGGGSGSGSGSGSAPGSGSGGGVTPPAPTPTVGARLEILVQVGSDRLGYLPRVVVPADAPVRMSFRAFNESNQVVAIQAQDFTVGMVSGSPTTCALNVSQPPATPTEVGEYTLTLPATIGSSCEVVATHLGMRSQVRVVRGETPTAVQIRLGDATTGEFVSGATIGVLMSASRELHALALRNGGSIITDPVTWVWSLGEGSGATRLSRATGTPVQVSTLSEGRDLISLRPAGSSVVSASVRVLGAQRRFVVSFDRAGSPFALPVGSFGASVPAVSAASVSGISEVILDSGRVNSSIQVRMQSSDASTCPLASELLESGSFSFVAGAAGSCSLTFQALQYNGPGFEPLTALVSVSGGGGGSGGGGTNPGGPGTGGPQPPPAPTTSTMPQICVPNEVLADTCTGDGQSCGSCLVCDPSGTRTVRRFVVCDAGGGGGFSDPTQIVPNAF